MVPLIAAVVAWAYRHRARRTPGSTSTANTPAFTPSSRRWTRCSSTGTSHRATASSTNTTTTPRTRRTASSTVGLTRRRIRPNRSGRSPTSAIRIRGRWPRWCAPLTNPMPDLRRVLSLPSTRRSPRGGRSLLAEVDGVGDWGMNNFYLLVSNARRDPHRFRGTRASRLVGVAASICAT